MKAEEEEPKKLSNGYLLIKEEEMKKKQVVRYKECRKNHAANIGGYAVDGCCEFMAAGEEGTISALRCAACGCHRNFHRREVENVYLCQCYSCDRSSSIC